MRRLHVISHPEHEMGGEIYYREQDFMHDPELHRAFTCGVKQGWREAMEEAERSGGYHERRWRDMPPMMREHDRYHDSAPDEIVYRRQRDARGRWM